MDIRRRIDGAINEVDVCIDQDEGTRLPTHQEYQIIRDVLGIPEAPESSTTILIPNAKLNAGWEGGTVSFTATGLSPEAVKNMYGPDGGNAE